ncbi:hypothetical protein BKA69DRAFT_1091700 [Paraphysoderma sedebokerense]|nr:hypothetical protein BKA69DRAFT_1091700 [Paraphysoderma sedebokerense]
MHLQLISFIILAILSHVVRTQSLPPTNCSEPLPSIIVNNPCNPLLDKKGVNISVEPVNTSSLYNKYIDVPKDEFNKWHFLRIDCSNRNGEPLNVTAIRTYQMSYIIALVNCTIGFPEKFKNTANETIPEGYRPMDILFVNCKVHLEEIYPRSTSGLIFQSSILPPSFTCRNNFKFISLRSRAVPSIALYIVNRTTDLVVLPDKRSPLEGVIHIAGDGAVENCVLGDSKMSIDFESNFSGIWQCGLKNNWTVFFKSIRSNLDIMILMIFSIIAVMVSTFDRKQRAKPVASLSISILSTYSSLSRIAIAFSTEIDNNLILLPIIVYSVTFLPILISVIHSIYMTPKLCRLYRLPNNLVTWLLMALGPSNFEILWSNFLGLKIFSHGDPKIKPEIMGLLEIHRSIAQDIGVSLLTELINPNVSIGKMLRNCITVFTLINTLRHWKGGRVYAKLGFVLLAIPAFLNIVLLFPSGLLYMTAYAVYMLCLTFFGSTLIGITKYTANESKYAGIWFCLGPIIVVGYHTLRAGLLRDFSTVLVTRNHMFLMAILVSILGLLTNIWHYRRIWMKNEKEFEFRKSLHSISNNSKLY